jgi:hypothetical protein
MIAHELRGRDLPVWLEAGCVIAGTVGACVLTYEAVRRVAPLGLCSACVSRLLSQGLLNQGLLNQGSRRRPWASRRGDWPCDERC